MLVRSTIAQFEQYVKLNKKVPPEILTSLSGIDEPGPPGRHHRRAHELKLDEKQRILEIEDPRAPRTPDGLIEGEIDLLQIEKRIRGRVKQQMEKSQREYYLNEQMKAIQKELGELDDAPNEIEELQRQDRRSQGMPKEAKEKATAELNKLKMMSPMSAEATVVRNYIDWLVSVPWKKRSKVARPRRSAEGARRRPLRSREGQGAHPRVPRGAAARAQDQGPDPLPGRVRPASARRRSASRSPARPTASSCACRLGGVRDEAEIRGHRRTYIGSMPGKIIQNLSKVGVRNPLFLLDEVDKMAMDFRGDPSSALLEVLDPEQNHTFNDHYLEVDYDLSDVMFVATANSMNIPPPLLDRMEVIRLSGYTEDEKLNIASVT